ncbi:hypothetical protein E0Z10_g5770 [Xylaria hypoxylon]|uniref:ATP-dependent RNA helicase n=1 Tax=Xylaria hypoxylon TaxID=37992 RepID=A0A4Z0YV17_9PEZI|nr:hypothetical protein E0Z10_g5770 [Xylaria hypoxylon]
MFRASIQRQCENTRSEHLAILRQTPLQPALRCLAPRYAFSHLYSTESAAAQANREGEFAPVPSAPVTRFGELSQLGVNDRLIEALTRGMGYDAMTEVQAMTINPALKGSDMVAQAKTGTGKTLAFLVPVFQRVLTDQPDLADPRARRRSSSEDIRAIILSPTRELAEQIGAEARKLAKNTSIVVQTAVGGTRKREALFKMWREGCDILVATPGRLNDLLSDPEAKVAAPKLQAFVLDEADRMLDVGFSDEIRSIQDLLPSHTQVERQTLLFSATIPRDVVHLAKSMVRPDNFEFVQTVKSDDVPTHERVPQHLVTVQGFENIFPTILEILHKANTAQDSSVPFKAIVFFSNTASVQFASEVFRKTPAFIRGSGTHIYEIHSKLTQGQRTSSADYFRRASSAVLFSSDVTARGMDFPNVTDVIQIGLPPDRDQYVHRVGRTGRAGNSGKGWLILAEQEVPEARSRLPGLPIKPNDTLESPKHVLGDSSASGDVSRFFSEVSNAYQSVPKSSFRAVSDVITLLNNWCLRAMGWAETPAVPPKIAQNRNLARAPGIRIGFDVSEEPVERGYGNRGYGNRGYDNRSGRDFSFKRDDGFESRGRSEHSSPRGGGNFRGSTSFGARAPSNRNSFEDRFASRAGGGDRGGRGGGQRYTPRASF